MLRLAATSIALTRADIDAALESLDGPKSTQSSVGPGKSINISKRRPRHHQRTPSSPKLAGIDQGTPLNRSPLFTFQSSPGESSEEEENTDWDVSTRRVPFRTLSYDSVANQSESVESHLSGSAVRDRSPPSSEQDDRSNRPRMVSRPSRLNNIYQQNQTTTSENNALTFQIDEEYESDGISGEEGSFDAEDTIAGGHGDINETSDMELGDDPVFDSDGYLDTTSGGSSLSGDSVHLSNEVYVEPSDDESEVGERTSNSSGHSTRLTSIFRRRHIPYSRHTTQHQRSASRSITRRSSITSNEGSTRFSFSSDSVSPATRVHTVSGPSEGIAASSLADSIELRRMRYAPILNSSAHSSVPDLLGSSVSHMAATARSVRSIRRASSAKEASPNRSRLPDYNPPRRNPHTPSSPTSASPRSQSRIPTIANITLPSLSAPKSDSTPASASYTSRAMSASWFRWAHRFSRRASRDDEHTRSSSTRNNNNRSEQGTQFDGPRDLPHRQQSEPTIGRAATLVHPSPVRRSTDTSSFASNMYGHRFAPHSSFSSQDGNPSAEPIDPSSTSSVFGGVYYSRFRGNRG